MVKLCCFLCDKNVIDTPQNSFHSLTEQSCIPIHEFICKHLKISVFGESSGVCGACQERINNLDIAIIRVEKQKKTLLDDIANCRQKKQRQSKVPELVYADDIPVKQERTYEDDNYDMEGVENEENTSDQDDPKQSLDFKGKFSNYENQTFEDEIHICDMCGKRYKSKAALQVHVNRHMGLDKVKLQCDICLENFTNKRELNRHVAFHTNPMIIQNTVLNFIHSQKGNRKLIHDGHIYHREKERAGQTYWKCRKAKHCHGRVITIGNSSIEITKEHSHPGDNVYVEAQLVQQTIRELTASSEDSPSEIVLKAFDGVSDLVKAKLPGIPEIKKTIRNIRSRQKSGLDSLLTNCTADVVMDSINDSANDANDTSKRSIEESLVQKPE